MNARDRVGLLLGAVAAAVFALGALVNLYLHPAIGTAIAFLGFLIGIVGFVFHVTRYAERRAERRDAGKV